MHGLELYELGVVLDSIWCNRRNSWCHCDNSSGNCCVVANKICKQETTKVEFSDNIVVVPSQGDLSQKREYVGITVTNIGNRRIKVSNWQVRFPDGHGALIMQDTSPIGKMLASTWPVLLEPEDQGSQYWEKRLFYAFIKEEAPKYKKKNFRLLWIVKDSTNKEYKVRSPKTIAEYFDEAEAYYHADT